MNVDSASVIERVSVVCEAERDAAKVALSCGVASERVDDYFACAEVKPSKGFR